MNAGHLPVMLEPVLELLDPRPGGRFVDATLGLAGHAERIAERIGPSGLLIGIDRDAELLARAEQVLARFAGRVRLVHARLSYLKQVVEGAGLDSVDGVLLDLGVCSVHLDDPARGFSFKRGGSPAPLDMRMDRSRGETAAELIGRLDEEALADVLRDGGAPAPRALARAIQAHAPLATTQELVDALRGVKLPRRHHHPATLVFQALRIAVNDEMGELDRGLEAAVAVLAPGGRLAVLTYHSGEDRRVKQFIAAQARGCICPPDLPICGCGRSVRLRPLVRGRRADSAEVRANPRARSALLRGAERC
jgi:16S rRNA (cytosine1402-N4)-methyltransferase